MCSINYQMIRVLKARNEKTTSGFNAWNDIDKIFEPEKTEVPN